ncbi:hypothetical protein RCF98_03345 [Thiothrix lacustris]|uniref:Uncharacterized protein n=1 Tax=Thiothrix lacustris TaxID=525917 RepID=A0ABY9MTC1_9GAMM|nr:hypothetical protein [Thiothrix lacustris]WML91395.1 hypothetical protein RCF98_03345 [Thiothrix lacustris]
MTQKDSNYFSLVSQYKEIKKGADSKAQEQVRWVRNLQAAKGNEQMHHLRMMRQIGNEADALYRQLEKISQEIHVRYDDIAPY